MLDSLPEGLYYMFATVTPALLLFYAKMQIPDDSLYNYCLRLLQEGLSSRNPFVRLRAVFLAGETGNIQIAPGLIKVLLTEKKPSIRGRAAEAIGKIADRSALESLKTALTKDKDPFTRACAVEAIGKIKDRAWLDLARVGLEDKDEMVKAAAVEAMVRLGDGSVSGYLRSALKSEHPQARRWACDALAGLVDTGALAGLQEMARNDTDPLVLIWAARAVLLIQKATGAVMQKDYLLIIGGFAQNKDPNVRSRVACALGDIATEPCLLMLEDILKRDRDTLVKIWAAEAIGKLGPGALPCLIEVAGSDPDRSVKSWAAEAIGKLGEPVLALGIVREFLKDRDPVVRLHAAKSVLGLLSLPKT